MMVLKYHVQKLMHVAICAMLSLLKTTMFTATILTLILMSFYFLYAFLRSSGFVSIHKFGMM